jgi:aryl-alcohol dehydrogenase-like predicted oxidoreductase
MKIDRRNFLRSTLAGAAALTGAGVVKNADAATSEKAGGRQFSLYDKRELGQTGIQVSRVGLGTGVSGWRRASNHTRGGQENFTPLVRGCLERGMNWFDTADLYGTMPMLKEALTGVPRESYVLVSKIWTDPRDALPEAERPNADVVVKRFLEELGTDYIDLLQLHLQVRPDWIEDQSGNMEIMERLKQQGVIRAHGVSIHDTRALDRAIESDWVDIVHERINPFGISMSASPDVMADKLGALKAAGKGVIGMKICGNGNLRNSRERRQESLDYVLNLGVVDAMIIGFESLTEVDDYETIVKDVAVRDEPLPARGFAQITPGFLDQQLAHG